MTGFDARLARANERRRKDDRNMLVYSMWKAGHSAPDISRFLTERGDKISRQMVDKIIKRELEAAKASRQTIAEELFDGELERLTAIVRNAWAIVTSNCRECDGRGSMEGIAGVGASAVTCKKCNGDGKSNHPDVRIRAMKEARAAIDQRAKMLGLYEPEKFLLTHDGTMELTLPDMTHISEDELDRALADYQAGVEAGIRLNAMSENGNRA